MNQQKIKYKQQNNSENTSHQRALHLSEQPLRKILVGKFETVFDYEVGVIIKRELDDREKDLNSKDEEEKLDVNILID
jgi:hypothetical protein